LGLAPEFEVELKTKNPITQYNIVADQKMVGKKDAL
jgi:trigger factor